MSRTNIALLPLVLIVLAWSSLRSVDGRGEGQDRSSRSMLPGARPAIDAPEYPSLTAATSVSNKIATSQIALPKATCDLVYATAGYESSITNLSQVTLATDGIFSDGSALQLATVTGTVSNALTATLAVAV